MAKSANVATTRVRGEQVKPTSGRSPRRPVSLNWEARVRERVRDVPRVLGRAGPTDGGATLVCLGGLHGNEPAGVVALQRVFARLSEDSTGLSGQVVGLSGNRRALARGMRYVDEDLNRLWSDEDGSGAKDEDQATSEAQEKRELSRAIEEALTGSEGYLLDLHSTSGGGAAFVSLDDTLANRAFAFALPAPHVLGIEEQLAGTLVSYLVDRGITAIGFEAGQHLDPYSVDRAEAAIWIAMETSGVLRRDARPEIARARRFLAGQSRGLPSVVEVVYRHPVCEDGFVMEPGFTNFAAVDDGQLLAHDADGPVTSCARGMILMPLYQKQGDDGYFLVRSVRYSWLRASALARRMRLDRFVHLLPGVRRSHEPRGGFLVDKRRARWLALQVFHLLGYKRIAETPHQLILRRRDGSRE